MPLLLRETPIRSNDQGRAWLHIDLLNILLS
jgi:hypothetical protein